MMLMMLTSETVTVIESVSRKAIQAPRGSSLMLLSRGSRRVLVMGDD